MVLGEGWVGVKDWDDKEKDVGRSRGGCGFGWGGGGK